MHLYGIIVKLLFVGYKAIARILKYCVARKPELSCFPKLCIISGKQLTLIAKELSI